MHLKNLGIDVGIHFIPVHKHKFFSDSTFGDMTVTEKVVNEILTLPLHTHMKKEYVKIANKSSANKRLFFLSRVPYKHLFNVTMSADVGCALIKENSINNHFALPNKLFEYTLMGLPVISSPLQNIQQVVKKYNLGIIVGENSIGEQLNAVQYIKKIKISIIILKKLYGKNLHGIYNMKNLLI